jgi:hypothetical protein
MGGDAANATEPIGPVARKFFRWNLGLARGADADANDLTSAVDVGAYGFADFGADGGESLGEFGGGDAIDRQTIVVDALYLLNLAGFESLGTTVNGFDKSTTPNATKIILDENSKPSPIDDKSSRLETRNSKFRSSSNKFFRSSCVQFSDRKC